MTCHRKTETIALTEYHRRQRPSAGAVPPELSRCAFQGVGIQPFLRLATVLVVAFLCLRTSRSNDQDKPRVHGPIDLLQDTLVQSADDFRLLKAAERQLKDHEEDSAFRALLAVFANPWDSFTPVLPDQPVQSTHESALQLLLKADFRTRVAWNQTVDPEARQALQRALFSDDVGLQSVSRRYPLTRSGRDALVIQAMLAASHGRLPLASAIYQELVRVYGTVSLPFQSAELISAVRQQLSARATLSESVPFGGTSALRATTKQNMPWNKSLWSWHDNVWSQAEVVGTLGGLSLAENRDVLVANAWQPTIDGDHIIFRSPLRITAFDKLTGNERWSVATDTIRSVEELSRDVRHRENVIRLSPRDLVQMDDMGSFTYTGEYLFFIDHFRRFSSQSWMSRNGFRAGVRDPEKDVTSDVSEGGTRLVAIRLHPVPKIVWTNGTVNGFQYRVRRQNEADAVYIADESGHSKPTEDQFYLGTPLAYGQQLFVLSADGETIWLNCLNQSSGRTNFRRPLLYQSENSSPHRQRYRQESILDSGASLCGVFGDAVISAVKNGILVATSLHDGQLRWATNVADDLQSPDHTQRRLWLSSTQDDAGPPFSPLIAGRHIVWAAPGADWVHCVNAESGQIAWKVPRLIISGGSVEGSRDLYAAGVFHDHVIMIGGRHVRSLRLEDGKQQWIVPVQPQSGRAVCTEGACLVPQKDGTLAAVDLSSGVIKCTSEDAFSSQEQVIGALSADENVLCAATPISLTVFPSAEYIKAHSASDSTPNSPALRELNTGRRLLLYGDEDKAVAVLQSLIVDHADSGTKAEAERLLAEVILRRLAASQYNSATGAEKTHNVSDFSVLNRLRLTSDQAFRRMLLNPDTKNFEAAFGTADTVTELLPGWKVRQDMAALSLLPLERAEHLSLITTSADSVFRKLEQLSQFPDAFGDLTELIAFAERLESNKRPEAAELALLSVFRDATRENRGALHDRIRGVRGAIFRPPAEHDEVWKEFPILTEDDVSVEEALSLSGNNRISELIAAGRVIVDVPGWYSRRLFAVNRQLFSVDMETGAVHLPSKMPAPFEIPEVIDAFETPAILPVVNSDHIGAVSLLSPASPKLLWWKRLSRGTADVSRIEIGPFGSGFLVVSIADEILCLHPLTGSVLWSRRFNAGTPAGNLFQRSPRIIGDENVIGVIGANRHTCEVFRTSDGAPMSSVVLDIPIGQTPLISGRRVLSQIDGRLVLRDIIDGSDALQAESGISVIPGSQARLLANHRAVMMTPDLEIIVLNLQSGKTEVKCSVAELFDGTRLAGLNAVERNGDLFILIKNWGNPLQNLSASSRVGEWRLDSGTLFCIDLSTKAVRWHRPAAPAVMPEIYGDPSPLLVTWSIDKPVNSIWQLQLGGQKQENVRNETVQHDSMVLQLIDGRTGRTILEKRHLSPVEPIRCVHDADKQILLLESDRSRIQIRY